VKNLDSPVVSESQERLSFSSLKLRDALQANLESLDYQDMTSIQAESLPIILDGLDIIAQAKTGSGKTAAFGLALLNRINVEHYAIQALVLCPTRELAEQVSQALRRLARLIPNIKILNLSGGMPMRPQVDSLRHGAHIIVGTPGRVQKHLDKASLSLNKLQTLVLDEADRMLDMGFFDAIKKVIHSCPKTRQTLLFSATYPDQIKQLASEFMHNPQRVIIDEAQSHLGSEVHFVSCDVNQPSNAELCAYCRVAGVPFLAVFIDGRRQEGIMGLGNESDLLTDLQERLSKADDSPQWWQFWKRL